jgi:antitoxin component of MazEF toxin-antitoxin module
MALLVVRTLFRTGESLAVTLPAAWVRYQQLKAGDRVEIVINDDLVVRTKRTKEKSLYSHKDLTN